ncbi:MAG TPA: hypothetical protein VLA67_11375 [Nitrospiraceae bacterium]|nr:hypothetical protein [Terriglobia bacterium]HSF68015.1 hypothetical protein [Nitrospiraceae bacterium]
MNGCRIGCVLVVSLAWSLASGCAAFRGGEAQPPTLWPLSKEPGKQSISLLISGEAIVNGQKADVNQLRLNAFKRTAEKAYLDSGLFSDVKIGAAETDLQAEIHLISRSETNTGMAVLSGFTLTLIPAKGEREYVLKTILKNKEGQALGTLEQKEPMTNWMQFFLIFIMPFNWPSTVATEIFYDLNRTTVIQAHSAGLLAQSHPPLYEWAYIILGPSYPQ